MDLFISSYRLDSDASSALSGRSGTREGLGDADGVFGVACCLLGLGDLSENWEPESRLSDSDE